MRNALERMKRRLPLREPRCRFTLWGGPSCVNSDSSTLDLRCRRCGVAAFGPARPGGAFLSGDSASGRTALVPPLQAGGPAGADRPCGSTLHHDAAHPRAC